MKNAKEFIKKLNEQEEEEPEEEEHEGTFYLDLPNPESTSDDDSWVAIKVCKTRKEALQILQDRWGIDEDDADVFITEGGE